LPIYAHKHTTEQPTWPELTIIIIINLFANHQSQLNAVAICNIYRYLVDNICVDKLAKSFSGRSDVFGRWQ